MFAANAPENWAVLSPAGTLTAPEGAEEGPVSKDALAQTVIGGEDGALKGVLDTVADVLNKEGPATPSAPTVNSPRTTAIATE